jgi:hypothetical protein
MSRWAISGIMRCTKSRVDDAGVAHSIALIGRGQSRRPNDQTRGLDPPVRRANRNESHDRRDQRTAVRRVQSAGGADLVEPHEPRETCHVGGDMAANLRPTRIGCSGSMAKLPQRRHRRPDVPAASLGLRPDVVNNGTIGFLRARFDRQLTVGPRLMRQ